jgi:aspartyl-tRNA(Asn)/glutamyl-tRNA(Gln) amidotransferase subunit A
LGFMRDFIVNEASNDIKNHLEFLRDRFEQAGAAVVDLALPESFSRVASAHQTIFETDLACYHRESFASRAHQYPPNIKARIEKGLQIPGNVYVEALRTRAVFQREICETLSSVDAVFMPAASTTAPHGLDSTGSSVANVPWSFSGFPSISLPSGLDASGLPLGVQIVGLPWADEKLAAVASWCEGVLAFDFAPEG